MSVKTYFINKNDIDKLIHQYTVENLGLNKLGEMWNCSSHTIKRTLLNEGENIKLRDTHEQKAIMKFSDMQIKDIINKYINLLYPLYVIANEHGVTPKVIKRIILKAGEKIRPAKVSNFRFISNDTSNYNKIITLEEICNNIKHIFQDYEMYIKAAERCWLENTDHDIDVKVQNVLSIINGLKNNIFSGSYLGEIYCPVMYLYIFINIINGKLYIGQTNDIIRRYEEHLYESRNIRDKSQTVDKALNKYEPENFMFIPFLIIKNATQNETDDLERFFIKIFNCKKEGYNFHDGGSVRTKINFTKQQIKEIIIKYGEQKINQYGKKYFVCEIKTLANEYSVSPSIIRRILTENDIEIRTYNRLNKPLINKRIIKPEQEGEVARLYIEDGLNASQIAKMYDAHVSGVSEILKRTTDYNGNLYYFKNKEDIDKLIYQYTVENLSLHKLASYWGSSRSTIKKIFISQKIIIKTATEQRELDKIQIRNE